MRIDIKVHDESGDCAQHFDLDDTTARATADALLSAEITDSGRVALAQPSGRRIGRVADLPADTQEVHVLAPFVGG